MLHLAKTALNPNFLDNLTGGLLLVFDESKRTTHLGWIEKATLQGAGIRVTLKQSVVKNHRDPTTWEKLEFFTFEVQNLEGFTALDHCGGFHCSDSSLSEPTFKIYPASSIPTDCVREHASLIEYGNVML